MQCGDADQISADGFSVDANSAPSLAESLPCIAIAITLKEYGFLGFLTPKGILGISFQHPDKQVFGAMYS